MVVHRSPEREIQIETRRISAASRFLLSDGGGRVDALPLRRHADEEMLFAGVSARDGERPLFAGRRSADLGNIKEEL